MKASLAIIFIFVVVIVLVYQSGYTSPHPEKKIILEPPKQQVVQPETTVPEPVSPAPSTEPVQGESEYAEEEPDEPRKVVYYIEKTYIKEIHHTEVVYREPEQHEYQTASQIDHCSCADFTGSTRTKCQRYIDAGYTCPQFEATISYVYQPNNIWR